MKNKKTLMVLWYLLFAICAAFAAIPLGRFQDVYRGYSKEQIIYLCCLIVPLIVSLIFSGRFLLKTYPGLEEGDKKIAKAAVLVISFVGFSWNGIGIWVGGVQFIPYDVLLCVSSTVYLVAIYLSLSKMNKDGKEINGGKKALVALLVMAIAAASWSVGFLTGSMMYFVVALAIGVGFSCLCSFALYRV
jgi:NADH:ubiquinone oxidoreductase subunit K